MLKSLESSKQLRLAFNAANRSYGLYLNMMVEGEDVSHAKKSFKSVKDKIQDDPQEISDAEPQLAVHFHNITRKDVIATLN